MNPLSGHLSPLSGIRPLSQTDSDSVTWVGGLAADFANRLVSYLGAFMPSLLAVFAIIVGVGLLIATVRFFLGKL